VRLGVLAVKNVLRNRVRTFMTVVGVAVSILVFVLLQTVLSAWTSGADHAAKDRVATRHKVTFIMPLPKRYVADMAEMPGITAVTWHNWFGGKHPARENDFFATIACDPDSFAKVYEEIVIPPEQFAAWKQNRRGAVIGAPLARRFGWKVGDKVTILGTIFPGEWEFHIEGIYTTTRKSVDPSAFWFQWDYLNESLRGSMKDQVGWTIARIDDPTRSADIAKAIDAKFAERDTQTLSMSERAMQVSFLGMFTAILKALDIVSIVILLIMVLILGNTIAMAVRERTSEYGVLRAIGFRPRHIAAFVLGEALTIGVLGGGLGLLISYPLIEKGLGRVIEETMGGVFPYFRIANSTAVAAVILAAALGMLAAALPAYRAAKLNVVDSLRRVG
jgi:putative ABC transport system permease protein